MGLVGNAADLIALVRDKSPELVIVDIRMPPTNTTEGLEAARQIRAEWPDIGILVLSAHVHVEHAMKLLASGRKIGYLLKDRVIDVRRLRRQPRAHRARGWSLTRPRQRVGVRRRQIR